jgi:hypothetical protein
MQVSAVLQPRAIFLFTPLISLRGREANADE